MTQGDGLGRPSDITDSLKKKLKDAMVSAYMAKGCIEDGSFPGTFQGFEGDGDGGSVRFTYDIDFGGANGGAELYVWYPDGQWRRSNTLWDSDIHVSGDGTAIVSGGENSYQVSLFDPKAKWAEIESEISSWFDPWQSGPNPAAFRNQIDSLTTVANQLYAENGSAGGAPGPDLDLESAIDTVKGQVRFLRGASVLAFQNTYVDDIDTTIGGQQGLAAGLATALEAEAAAWSETYLALETLLGNGAYDFHQLAGSHPASGERVDAVLGAVTAVSSLLGGTVGKAYPPLGTTLGVLSGGIGVFRAFNRPVAAVEDVPIQLTGGTYSERKADLIEKIKEINAELKACEESVALGCDNLVAYANGNIDGYSLTRTTKGRTGYHDESGESGYYRPNGQHPTDTSLDQAVSEIQISHTILAQMVGACRYIGDHQIGAAQLLNGHDAQGDPVALVLDEWLRGSLPEVGTIGWASDGPYANVKALLTFAVDLLVDEGKNSRDVADALAATNKDFKDSDERQAWIYQQSRRQFDDKGPDEITLPHTGGQTVGLDRPAGVE